MSREITIMLIAMLMFWVQSAQSATGTVQVALDSGPSDAVRAAASGNRLGVKTVLDMEWSFG